MTKCINYSHYVTIMKRGLVVLCIGFVFVLSVWPAIIQRKHAQEFKIVMQQMKGVPSHMEMISPVYVGTDKEGRKIRLTADKGLPDAPNPSVIHLNNVTGRVQEKEGWTTLESKKAVYQINQGTVLLNDDIHVNRSDGYKADAQQMTLNLKDGVLTSDKPFTSTGSMGSLTGQRIEIDQKQNEAVVKGGVRMVIQPSSGTAKESSDTGSDKPVTAPVNTPLPTSDTTVKTPDDSAVSSSKEKKTENSVASH